MGFDGHVSACAVQDRATTEAANAALIRNFTGGPFKRSSLGGSGRGYQAGVADHARVAWGREELQEAARFVGVLARRNDRCRELGDVLHLLREVAHDVDALDGQQLAALLTAEVGLLLRDDFADRCRRNLAPLRADLRGYAELVEHFAFDVFAARAVGPRDGTRREQRGF